MRTLALAAPEGALARMVARRDPKLPMRLRAGAVLPADWLAPRTLSALRKYLERGGQLLLEEGACRLAEALALIEPGSLRVGAYGHGLRGESDGGVYRVGLAPVPELRPRDAEGPIEDAVYWLQTGRLLRVQYTLFDERGLRDGKALASFAREQGGSLARSRKPVLVEWQLGRGRVVACGMRLRGPGPLAASFSKQQDEWLLRALGSALCSIEVREPAGAELPIVKSRTRKATPWGAYAEANMPRPAHLGVALGPRSLRRADLDELLARLHAQAVDLVAIDARNEDGDYSFDWPEAGPVPRAPAYRSVRGGLRTEELREKVQVLEEHGLLTFLDLPDEGFAGASRKDTLLFFHFLADALFDPMKKGCLDGIAASSLSKDPFHLRLAALRDRNPAAVLLTSDGSLSALEGAVGRVLPRVGSFAGLPLRGVDQRGLEAAFPADLYSVLRVDASRSHGSWPDWVHRQAKDFLRHRRGSDSSLVLDLESAEAPAEAAKLLPLLRDPLGVAASYPLTTTGRGGYREALMPFAKSAEELRSTEKDLAGSYVLENRYFRLVDASGGLYFDRTRSGDFRDPIVISKAFMKSRLLGARPGPKFLVEAKHSFRPVAGVGEGRSRLSNGVEDTQWPMSLDRSKLRELTQAVELPEGRYRLQVDCRPDPRGALLELRLGDRVLGYLSANDDQTLRGRFEFGISRQGTRSLELSLLHGSSVDLLGAEIERCSDIARETVSGFRVGRRVVQEDRVSCSFYKEKRRSIAIGDFPGFVLDVRYSGARGGLRLDRDFALPGYHVERVAMSHGRRPWILRGEGLPTLWIYELGFGRQHSMRFVDGRGFYMRSHPRSHDGFSLGLIFADEFEGKLDPSALGALLPDFVEPKTLTPRREHAELRSTLPLPWPQVFRLPANWSTPMLLTSEEGSEELLLEDWGDGPRGFVSLSKGKLSLDPLSSRPFRPLPGSRRLLRIRRVLDGDVTVQITGRSPVCSRPGLRFDRFAESALLDGKAWCYRDHRDIYLPRSPGTHVLSRGRRIFDGYSVLATSADLASCERLPGDRLLVRVAAGTSDAWRGGLAPLLRIAGRRPKELLGARLHGFDPPAAGPGQRSFRLRMQSGTVEIRMPRPSAPTR